MKTKASIGVQSPQVYLPCRGIDLKKWAVVACDQFTSQPEYWERVAEFVGDAPSTLKLIFPEVYLNAPDVPQRITAIQSTMRDYLDKGILEPHEGMIYVERSVDGKTRRGLMLCLDLERYDYHRGSTSLIRPTEGTILERIAPRVQIRQNAVLELPHILVLIDDPEQTVIEPIVQQKHSLKPLYETELMFGGGFLVGYALTSEEEERVFSALEALAQPSAFARRYGVGEETPVLLFAVGDGNHSLATAKAVWEQLKPQASEDHPARYALVEIENVHDPGIIFEPIHRLLFGVKKDLTQALREGFGESVSLEPVQSLAELTSRVHAGQTGRQTVGLIFGGEPQRFAVAEFLNPTSNLAVGTLQTFLDRFLTQEGAESIDYIHGEEALLQLSTPPDRVGFYLPAMSKHALFETVIRDGVLPRKTFSMGEAHEKRYYFEARRILP
ncbi:MAG: DUF1015 domain-containing protein [Anaerolineales bacterium]|nr:DUF1015 domain-containing protein [Anaerolineales bacterium]MCS7248366.1 DUF1015 domain-containing protein [Anaerolineales bacterium]MDW8162179.1 DUF1015 domain-containing protein [Anaerolineales bacterium]MDW8446734.1 DUF1015 domain-containing protein [Anaerolineales bacterium]